MTESGRSSCVFFISLSTTDLVGDNVLPTRLDGSPCAEVQPPVGFWDPLGLSVSGNQSVPRCKSFGGFRWVRNPSLDLGFPSLDLDAWRISVYIYIYKYI